MVPELFEAFLYKNSTQELWDELTEKFGESNGPLLNQLEKEITDLYQGSDFVAVYYTKLKWLWDEINDTSDIPVCTCPETCPSIKKTLALDQRRKLMQFLMHLNDEYETIKGQILLLDPLPIVNKTYSMIQRVKKQRHVTNNTGALREIEAYVNRVGFSSVGELEVVYDLIARNKSKKDWRRPKSNKYCDHCQGSGHEKEQCFKLVGYPKWYDGLKSKKQIVGLRLTTNVGSYSNDQDTPLDEDNCIRGGASTSQFDSSFIQALAQQVMKLTKGKQSTNSQNDAMRGAYA